MAYRVWSSSIAEKTSPKSYIFTQKQTVDVKDDMTDRLVAARTHCGECVLQTEPIHDEFYSIYTFAGIKNLYPL